MTATIDNTFDTDCALLSNKIARLQSRITTLQQDGVATDWKAINDYATQLTEAEQELSRLIAAQINREAQAQRQTVLDTLPSRKDDAMGTRELFWPDFK